MKMSNLVLVFTLGLASLYLTLANDSQCKFPAQWQSNIYFDFGMMLAVQGQTNASGVFYYDYTNRQTRLDIAGTFTQDHHYNVPMYYTIIWQFNETAFYTIDHVKKTCEREDGIYDFWKQWEGVPSLASGVTDEDIMTRATCGAVNAHSSGTPDLTFGFCEVDATPDSFGAVGVKAGFIVQQYHLVRNRGEPSGPASVSLHVQVGDVCPPVRLAMRDLDLTPYSIVTYNYDFLDHTDIKDPRVFTPPPHCPNNTMSNTVKRYRSIPQHLGLFFG